MRLLAVAHASVDDSNSILMDSTNWNQGLLKIKKKTLMQEEDILRVSGEEEWHQCSRHMLETVKE